VLDLVLENRVNIIPIADRMNSVVIVVKVEVLVLDLVLENRVNLIPTVAQVNIVVVLMEHVP
jgi:hypothetical protein